MPRYLVEACWQVSENASVLALVEADNEAHAKLLLRDHLDRAQSNKVCELQMSSNANSERVSPIEVEVLEEVKHVEAEPGGEGSAHSGAAPENNPEQAPPTLEVVVSPGRPVEDFVGFPLPSIDNGRNTSVAVAKLPDFIVNRMTQDELKAYAVTGDEAGVTRVKRLLDPVAQAAELRAPTVEVKEA